LLPGPEAQQLATYIGWLMHRTLGGIVAGGLFVLPGIVAIMSLSYIYAAWGRVPFVSAMFFGLRAAVLAIVLEAVLRIGKRALKSPALIAIAALSFIGIFFCSLPFPLIIVGAAGLGVVVRFASGAKAQPDPRHESAAGHDKGDDSLLGDEVPEHAKPRLFASLRVAIAWLALWLVPVAVIVGVFGPANVFSRIAIFFSKTAIVTFGGAYAVLAYVAQEAVNTHGWLSPSEMLDGLGMAETTPGPLIMVLQFVGFMAAYRDAGMLRPMLAGTLGGLLATWVTFTPCFLWIFLGAPFIEILRANESLNAVLSAITAAVVGVVLNLAVWFAIHTMYRETVAIRAFPFSFDAPRLASLDPWALFLSAAAIVAIFGFRIGMIPTLAGCCAAGVALFATGIVA
jgi:chromate transporter